MEKWLKSGALIKKVNHIPLQPFVVIQLQKTIRFSPQQFFLFSSHKQLTLFWIIFLLSTFQGTPTRKRKRHHLKKGMLFHFMLNEYSFLLNKLLTQFQAMFVSLSHVTQTILRYQSVWEHYICYLSHLCYQCSSSVTLYREHLSPLPAGFTPNTQTKCD